MLVYPLTAACWIGMILHHAAGGHFATGSSLTAAGNELLGWMAMVGAMMLPTTVPAVDDLIRRSYRRRRLIASLEYLVGYLACWGMAGAIFVQFRRLAQMQNRCLVVLGCLLAAFWAMLPVRRTWFSQCHRQIPLCPTGWRADWDAVRQGATQGVPCVKMCWLLMVACGISEHDWGMMIGGTALAVWEKRMFRLDRAPIVAGSLTLAVWFLAQAALHPDQHLLQQSHHHH